VDFSNYRKQLFAGPSAELTLAEAIRNFSNWFFDLLRNFVLVGGLKYFAEKSESVILTYIHEGALLVILLYCLSYADQWYVNLFGFLPNKRLTYGLDIALNLAISVAIFLVINRGASIIVAEISRAQY
jgi:hypothetical protein